MHPKPNHHRGSVILIAVGLLVMLAMVGTTFVLVAYSDRREADSIARGAPMKKIALGVVTKIQAVLVEDLRFHPVGRASVHPYEAATEWAQQIDAPLPDVDRWLASTAMEDIGGGRMGYRHVTNLYGTLTGKDENIPAVVDTTPDTPSAVGMSGYGMDTNGDARVDALLEDTGIRDAVGARYYVAVRIIDTCGLVNANTAYRPDFEAGAAAPVMPYGADNQAHKDGSTHGLPVMHVDCTKLGLDADTLHAVRTRGTPGGAVIDLATYWRGYVSAAANQMSDYSIRLPGGQGYVPVFTQDDMLALLWRETDRTKATYTARGRLMEDVVGTDAVGLAKRPYLTTWSAARLLPLQIDAAVSGNLPQEVRANLNDEHDGNVEASFRELYTAFFNAIYRNIPNFTDGANAAAQDAKRRALAAQMAVNVIDYRDADGDVTVHAVPNSTDLVYGIERQPFLTEAFFKVAMLADGRFVKYSAIELLNPYRRAIDLKGMKLTQDGTEKTPVGGAWPAGLSIPAGSRMVIISSIGAASAIPVHANTPNARVIKIDRLDISKDVKIYRSRKYDGTGDKDVLLAEITLDTDAMPTEVDKPTHKVRQWDDRLDKARYTLGGRFHEFITRDYTNENTTTPMLPGNTNLGTANDEADKITAGEPTPVYVRNDKFVSIGEINRIFYIGPNDTKGSLAEQLGTGVDLAQGRLNALQALGPYDAGLNKVIPWVPPACLISEFITVANPSRDEQDNNSNWVVDEAQAGDYERAVYGVININTAPESVLLCLPYVTPGFLRQRRDGLLPSRERGGVLASAGEFLYYLRDRRQAIIDNNYPANYKLGDDSTTDDGLDPVHNDLTKYEIMYTRAANMITVRSDTFAAYITVLRYPAGANLRSPNAVKRYVAVIDRSECYKRGDWPRIYMFAAIK